MIGSTFGKLTVVSFHESRNQYRYWNCLCECGQLSSVRTSSLKSGVTRSCGCKSVEAALANCRSARRKRAIGSAFSRQLKDMFRNMHDRCTNTSNKRWDRYGGRGIRVCAEWSHRRTFYDWVIKQGYKEGLSIDRIDVNGNYEPNNCRLADRRMQQNNTTRNRYLTYSGETLTIAQWARRLGVTYQALQHRIQRGWSTDRIFNQEYR